jgi:hypothetical protein
MSAPTRPGSNTPTKVFITGIGDYMGIDPQHVAAVAKNLADKGKHIVSQLKESPQALVEDAARPIDGFYEVICAYIGPENDPPHVFSEPARPSGHGAAPPTSTGGPCGNNLDRQFDMDPILPTGMSVSSTRVMTTIAAGIVGDVEDARPDPTTPVSKAHLMCIVRNLAHHFMLLFGCLYIASSIEGDRGQVPAAYMHRTCKLVMEYFVVPGFATENFRTAMLIKMVTNRVNPHSPPPHPPPRPPTSRPPDLHARPPPPPPLPPLPPLTAIVLLYAADEHPRAVKEWKGRVVQVLRQRLQ